MKKKVPSTPEERKVRSLVPCMKARIYPFIGCLLCSLLWSSAELLCQNGLPPQAGIRGRALGGTGLVFTDAHSVWTNPAGLGRLEALGLNASGEQRFALAELQTVQFGAALPVANGGFGLSVLSFGFTSYRENRLGLSYGRQLSDNFRLGVELVGFNASVPAYESRFAATFSLGAQLDILDNLTVGFRAFSLMRVETAEGEFLPQLLSAGLGYRPNNKILLMAEIHQDIDFAARFRGGLEYQLTDQFHARLGVVSGPGEMSFGLGMAALENWRIEVGASWHEVLGLTPGVGLVYQGDKR